MSCDEPSSSMEQPPFSIRSKRSHKQIITNRKRYIFVESINDEIGWLVLETDVVNITTHHRYCGKLKLKNLAGFRSKNIGLISRNTFTELVKLIYLKDVPSIINDFEAGVPLNQIRYSRWPRLQCASIKCGEAEKPNDSGQISAIEPHVYSVSDNLHTSYHKNSLISTRLIKSISNLIGF